MYCTSCGAAAAPDARFCAQCGAALTQPQAESRPEPAAPTSRVVWESKNYLVPLDFEVSEDEPGEVRKRFDEIVGSHLYLLSKEGWEPDGPTDYRTLRAAGRVRVGTRVKGFLGFGSRVRVFKSVTIRVKRRVSA